MSVPPLPPPGFVATPLEWRNVTFVGTAHLLALSSIAWLVAARCSPWTIALGFVWFVLCGLAVTGGYHRLFAHPTYRAKAVVRAAYLVLGAAAVQNSALKWAADHRLHHAKTDREEDPYNIRRGFWWAHMGWVFHKDASPIESRRVQDLSADPLVRWQDRHYVLIALLVGAAVPALLGTAWRDPIGAVLVAGFLRLVVQWHATGLVNSFAHRFGSRPYSLETSARDSGWMALSSDRGTQNQKVDQGYGMVCDISGNPVDDLLVSSTNQEHGIITRRDGGRADCARFPVGTLLRILPNHACATAAPHDRYFVVNGGLEIAATWPRFNGW